MWIGRALLILAAGLLCENTTLAQELQVDVNAVKNLVSKWNDAHTVNTVGELSSLYSGTVNFYGTSLNSAKCIAAKRVMLNEQKDFSQVITGDLFLSGYSTGLIRCDFIKTVSVNGVATDYDAYLIVERIRGKYFIVGESDLITDSKLENAPDFGKKITIRQAKSEIVSKQDPSGGKTTERGWSMFTKIFLGIAALTIAVIGLIVSLRKSKHPVVTKIVERLEKREETIAKPEPNYQKPKRSDNPERFSRKPETVSKGVGTDEYFETGLAFEKFIVEQFAVNKGYFTLVDWRSDKFHEGIFPQSNRHPDLVYQYKYKDFIRTFAIECKYRGKSFNGTIQLMDDLQYRIYEAYHKTQSPVYIVLGFRGEPNNPEELFLIPFQHVKKEMAYRELKFYRKSGIFFYDMHTDRLT
jgi:hypothetical protein